MANRRDFIIGLLVGLTMAWGIAAIKSSEAQAPASASATGELVWVQGNSQGEARTILGDKPIWDGPTQASTSAPIKLAQNKVALVLAQRAGSNLDRGRIVGYLSATP